MKIWQVVVLVYFTTAVVAVHLGQIGTSRTTDGFVAFGITLLGILLIRRIAKRPDRHR